jgi:hypothetical protein
MPPKTTRNANIETEVFSADIGNPVPEEEIRRRAYDIYLERGEQAGSDLDDWLRAEQELQGGDLRREQEA